MGLIAFQLKFYTLSKIKYLTILQYFSNIVKTGKLIPIHKKDSKLEVSNRPSSLLSNIDKIFEKLLHNRLIEFLRERQIQYYKQLGF